MRIFRIFLLTLLLSAYCAAQSVMGGAAVAGGGAVFGAGAVPVTVDLLVHLNTSSPGTQITTTIMANGTDQQSLVATWTAPGTPANFTLGSGANNLVNGIRIRSNGDLYTSASAGSTIAQSGTVGFITWAQTGIPAGHKAATIAGYLSFAPPATGASNTLWDLISLQSIDGHNSVLQLRTGGTQSASGDTPACTASAYVVEIETNPGFVTKHSACITIVPTTTYWYSLRSDSIGGVSDLYIYSADLTTLIGHVTGIFGITNSDMSTVSIGNNESGTASVTNNFQWTAFDWTSAPFVIRP